MKIKNIALTVVGFLVLSALGGASAYFYSRYQHAQTLLRNPTAAVQEEVKILTSKVGEHIVLPGGEIPTVATVTDKSKLADQPFFARSEVGDKVLIYTQAAKAILYRPVVNKIIEVVALSQPSVAGTSTASAQLKAARLAIYNSTSTVGLASIAQQKVNGEISAILTVSKQNSLKNYQKTMVVVLIPEAKELGNQLGGLFKAEVVFQMPADEIKPETDLLLIVGEDYKP